MKNRLQTKDTNSVAIFFHIDERIKLDALCLTFFAGDQNDCEVGAVKGGDRVVEDNRSREAGR